MGCLIHFLGCERFSIRKMFSSTIFLVEHFSWLLDGFADVCCEDFNKSKSPGLCAFLHSHAAIWHIDGWALENEGTGRRDVQTWQTGWSIKQLSHPADSWQQTMAEFAKELRSSQADPHLVDQYNSLQKRWFALCDWVCCPRGIRKTSAKNPQNERKKAQTSAIWKTCCFHLCFFAVWNTFRMIACQLPFWTQTLRAAGMSKESLDLGLLKIRTIQRCLGEYRRQWARKGWIKRKR